MVNLLDLVELDSLGQPILCCRQVSLPGNVLDGVQQFLESCRNVFNAREIRFLYLHQSLNILSDQLRGYCFSDALDDYLGLNHFVWPNFFGPPRQPGSFQSSRTDQHTFQGSKSKIIVCLLCKALGTVVEEWHSLPCKFLCLLEALRK